MLAKECGLANMIDCIETDAWSEKTGLREKNPLCKLPVLETDDGKILFDSTVICAYLDTLHGGQRFIPVGEPVHWQVLQIQAVCDGILDAAFGSVMELRSREPAEQSEFWLKRHRLAIVSAINWLEEHFSEFGRAISFAPICVAVALGYIDFRMTEISWRERNPKLSNWYQEFSQRDSIRSTNPAA